MRLEVSDRGLGIKRQNMPHIFEPFFTSNEEAQGAGLGLAIARELAERMQGRLTVRSAPGSTTFSLVLPGMRRAATLLALLARRSSPAAATGAPTSRRSDRRRRRQGGAERSTTRVEVIESIGQEGGFDPKAIYKSEAPGVVTVVSLFGSGGLGSLLNGDDGGDGGGGVGSGFVLNGDGEIATNAHVVTSGEGDAIKRAREVYVEFADGNQVEAKILGADPNADVALLKIDPKGLKLRPLPLGDSASVEVGEPVAAIGSPFGERQSLSVGVVSAVDRSIESLTSFSISGAIQTDAAINPGNSGGPLVDGDGRVIGINQQIKTTSGGGEGVGFAVPIDAVKRSLGHAARRAARRATPTSASRRSSSTRSSSTASTSTSTRARGCRSVNAGGPAERAGIQGGGGAVDVPGAVVPARRRRDHEGRGQAGRGLRAARRRDRQLQAGRRGHARGPPRRGHAGDQGQARRAPARPGRRVGFSCVLQAVALAHKSLADYTHIVGRPLVEEIRELAEPLKGRRVVHLSATAFGGGVSEILYTLVPLMRDVGLEVEWQVIYGREEFFNATKIMHNALQGNPQDLTEEQWATWSQYNEMNARELSRGWDVCIVHDPQPAALLLARAGEGARAGCGAATSTSRRRTRPRWSGCCRTSSATRRRSSTSATTCPAGMNGGVNIVPPAIDPLTPKNMALSLEDAVFVCKQFGIDTVAAR